LREAISRLCATAIFCIFDNIVDRIVIVKSIAGLSRLNKDYFIYLNQTQIELAVMVNVGAPEKHLQILVRIK
jgi:hypothetical protein